MASKSDLTMYFKNAVEDAENKHKRADEFIIEILEYEGEWDELIKKYKEVIKKDENKEMVEVKGKDLKDIETYIRGVQNALEDEEGLYNWEELLNTLQDAQDWLYSLRKEE